QLHPIPDEFQETLTLCKGQPFTTIDLIEWVRTYPLLSVSFDWKDGYEGAYRVFDQPGIYEVEVIFPCGRIPGEVEVLTQDCRPYFYVPSAFSSNGDDVNDTFQAILQSPIEVLDFQFRVYDRWGRKMAEWTDPNFKWDGSNFSGNVRPGVYMWEVAMTFSRNGEVLGHRDKGALTILK
ncbi:MAG: gliding motility-associated C-terminal domain-containing protein, partial [Bacteroidota bacterium]